MSDTGIFVRTTTLLDQIHRRLREAGKLRGTRQAEEAARIEDAAQTLLSVLVAKDVRNAWVTLPEAVRRHYEVVTLTCSET
ncbi:hypothetical protein P3T23_004498 [Paraburkholderia sp. GAS448]|uniref:hypothetical protein n=1 Tax=Paraburkholderia sp. GAS448 TaxID=3035136 RepID=UPI003D1D4C86